MKLNEDCVPDGHADAALPVQVQPVKVLPVAGVSVIVHAGGGSFKSQFKRADASAASIAVILAGDELAAGSASVKMLRVADPSDQANQQMQVPLENLVAFLKDRI